MEKLYRITTDYFCAGLITKNEIVIEAAPILSWTIGKRFNQIRFKSNYYVELVTKKKS
jgi:hypothetical protein